VLADTDVLDTLSPREFRAGYAEVAKYGLIDKPDFFAWLEKNWQAVFAGGEARIEAIAVSCQAKADVVAADERENGRRALLNLGHTFGHALEAETRYARFLHGEAVGWGMVAATHLANRTGLLSESDRDEIIGTIAMYGPIPALDGITAEALAGRLASDKKTVKGNVHFVLPDRIGHVVIRPGVADAHVLDANRTALAA
jgi:3-dehydroquinate synthase